MSNIIRQNTASSNPRSQVRVNDVLNILAQRYGPFHWKPRYSPAMELVYTILSQHTSDINSERAFKNLLQNMCTLENVAQGDVRDIAEAINMGGLSQIKAPRIKQVLQQIIQERGSLDLEFLKYMPLDKAKTWLKRLPGIGPKSAAVILCFALQMPAMPVDTHIFRVSKRLGLIDPKTTAEQAHDILESMVKPKDVFNFHMYLINHGRNICKSLRPQCQRCVLAWGCPSRNMFIK